MKVCCLFHCSLVHAVLALFISIKTVALKFAVQFPSDLAYSDFASCWCFSTLCHSYINKGNIGQAAIQSRSIQA